MGWDHAGGSKHLSGLQWRVLPSHCKSSRQASPLTRWQTKHPGDVQHTLLSPLCLCAAWTRAHGMPAQVHVMCGAPVYCSYQCAVWGPHTNEVSIASIDMGLGPLVRVRTLGASEGQNSLQLCVQHKEAAWSAVPMHGNNLAAGAPGELKVTQGSRGAPDLQPISNWSAWRGLACQDVML